ncbi:hypothetical protein D5086_032232 [Populus alba]|uniref:Uncharacterized protein n=1 Tax=Populus alba TaxID=43335 RepID=A0ACC4AKT6_POPAL
MYMCSWIIMIQKTGGVVKRHDDNFGVGKEEYNTRQVKLKLLRLRLPLRFLGWANHLFLWCIISTVHAVGITTSLS